MRNAVLDERFSSHKNKIFDLSKILIPSIGLDQSSYPKPMAYAAAIRREIFSARGTASHRGYRAQNPRNSIARIYIKTGALSGQIVGDFPIKIDFRFDSDFDKVVPWDGSFCLRMCKVVPRGCTLIAVSAERSFQPLDPPSS